MLLDGKPAIGGLHPIGAAYAGDFAGESALGRGIADVLDDGIAEDDVEGFIAEGQGAAIAATQLEAPASSALVRGVLSKVTRGRTGSMSQVSGVPPTSSTRVSAEMCSSRAKRRMRRDRNQEFQGTEEW